AVDAAALDGNINIIVLRPPSSNGSVLIGAPIVWRTWSSVIPIWIFLHASTTLAFSLFPKLIPTTHAMRPHSARARTEIAIGCLSFIIISLGKYLEGNYAD